VARLVTKYVAHGVSLDQLSTWEHGWLIFDRAAEREAFPTLESVEELLGPPLTALAMGVMCLDDVRKAEQLVEAVDQDDLPGGEQGWVRWLLTGRVKAPAALAAWASRPEYGGEAHTHALGAALEGEWNAVEPLIHVSRRHARAKLLAGLASLSRRSASRPRPRRSRDLRAGGP
jgi:hypothetical protein